MKGSEGQGPAGSYVAHLNLIFALQLLNPKVAGPFFQSGLQPADARSTAASVGVNLKLDLCLIHPGS